MKKVGTITIGEHSSGTIWGDVYFGSEDSGVKIWGIVFFNLSKTVAKMNRSKLDNLQAEFSKETGYRLKTKTKKNRYSGAKVKFYVPRPADKMSDVLKAMDEYEPTDTDISIDIEVRNFDRIKRNELAKQL